MSNFIAKYSHVPILKEKIISQGSSNGFCRYPQPPASGNR